MKYSTNPRRLSKSAEIMAVFASEPETAKGLKIEREQELLQGEGRGIPHFSLVTQWKLMERLYDEPNERLQEYSLRRENKMTKFYLFTTRKVVTNSYL